MPLNNWMQEKFDTPAGRANPRLSEIFMPGSHDAGMYVTPDTSGGRTGKTITHFDDITTQLNNGARFFDIRVYRMGGSPRIGHYPKKSRSAGIFGAYGPLFNTVITDMVNWLTVHPTELIIIKATLSNDSKSQGHFPQIRNILNPHHASLWHANNGPNRHIARLQYQQARGHIFLCFEPSYAPANAQVTGNLQNRIHTIAKVSYSAPAAVIGGGAGPGILHLGGNAPTKSTYNQVRDVQMRSINRAAPHTNSQNRLNMFYLTITSSRNSVETNTETQMGMTGVARVPADVHRSSYGSWVVNRRRNYRRGLRGTRGVQGYIPNIVHYDFINPAVSTYIVNQNQGPNV